MEPGGRLTRDIWSAPTCVEEEVTIFSAVTKVNLILIRDINFPVTKIVSSVFLCIVMLSETMLVKYRAIENGFLSSFVFLV